MKLKMKTSSRIFYLYNLLFGIRRTRTVLYRARNNATGLTVTCDVYRPDASRDDKQSGNAKEIGRTGVYHFTFKSNGLGWFVIVSDNNGDNAIKVFD